MDASQWRNRPIKKFLAQLKFSIFFEKKFQFLKFIFSKIDFSFFQKDENLNWVKNNLQVNLVIERPQMTYIFLPFCCFSWYVKALAK